MIAFLIVTSLINVSLGYALAVYLSRARLHAAEIAPGELLDEWRHPSHHAAPAERPLAAVASETTADDRRTEERLATWPVDAAATATRIAAASEEAKQASSASPEDDLATASESPMMEKDLLAGIEEFRLQLAKIKGQAIAEPSATDLATPVGERPMPTISM